MTITRVRVARAAGLTAAVFTAFGAAATPANAAPAAPANTWNATQADLSPTVATDDVWIQSCRQVTAVDLAVFRKSTGYDSFTHLHRGDVVNVIDLQNGRYKINAPVDGWISADPRWTTPC